MASREFVGRRAEGAALLELVEAKRARLVSVVGPGGVGKTQLVQQLLASVRGALFIDLVDARSEADVVRKLAEGLSLSLASAATNEVAVAAIANDLASRERPLVVLDNFEQVLSAAKLVALWLVRAPEAQFLITTREALVLPEEELLSLGPLPEKDAVALFWSRVHPRTALLASEPEAAAIVREIVSRLEGLPLAVEFAAANSDVLGPSQILERLRRNPLSLGALGGEGAAGRSTMRDTIAWSFELLDPDERLVLAQVAVFRGGFSVEAAEAIVEVGRPVVELLSSLLAKHLLFGREVDGLVGETRLGMFQVVREFALEALGEQREAVLARHAEWAVAQCEPWSTQTFGARGAEYLVRLTHEEENLLALIERVREAPQSNERSVQLGLQALLALEPLTSRRAPAPFHEATAALLDKLLPTFVERHPDLVAAVFIARAHTQRWAGKLEAAEQDLARALRIAGEGRALRREAEALNALGVMAAVGDRLDEGRALLQRALELAERAGHPRLAARIRLDLGTIDHRRGVLGAWEAVAPVLPELEAHGDLEALAQARTRLGMFLLDEGGIDEARELLTASVAFYRARADRRREAWLHRSMALLEHVAGALGLAEKHARCALSLELGMGLRFGGANSRLALGSILRESGKVHEAEGELRRAADELGAAGDVRHAGMAWSRIGGLLAERDRLREAEVAFAEADQRLDGLSDERPRLVHAVERGQLELARARSQRDPELSASAIAAARSSLADAHRPGPNGRLVQRSLDAVLSARMLARALDAIEPPDHAWVIAEDGRWLRPRHGERVSIEHRPVLMRLLRAFLEQHLRSPGSVLGREALIELGWPGETLQSASALNRLHVALTTLRKLGLETAIVRAGEGWMLDPKLPLIVQR